MIVARRHSAGESARYAAAAIPVNDSARHGALIRIDQRSTDLVEGSEIGSLHKSRRFVCDSALYISVIAFGPAGILYHDREKKAWFLDFAC